MNDKRAILLLELLAEYAKEYGQDTDPGITAVDLADDLINSLTQYVPYAEELRDVIHEGLASS